MSADPLYSETSAVIGLDCFDGIIDIKSYKFGLVNNEYDKTIKECTMIN